MGTRTSHHREEGQGAVAPVGGVDLGTRQGQELAASLGHSMGGGVVQRSRPVPCLDVGVTPRRGEQVDRPDVAAARGGVPRGLAEIGGI